MHKNNTLILIGFILAKFLLQFILFNPTYDLHRDEYLHLDQGSHLDLGYQSVPPFSSWIAYVIQLLGGGVFWVKFFPAFFGALTIAVVWKAIEALKGNLFALILGATCLLFSVFLRTNTLFQPNSFDVLCWTTFYFILIKYINTDNAKYLFIAAFTFAIGFLNKYNIVFLALGLFPAILLTNHRKMFARKEFYYAITFGLILISPNIYWQYQNNFPVIHHMKLLSETQLVNVNRADFLKEQLLFFIAALPVTLASLYALLFYKPYKKYRLFFISFLITLSLFIFLKAKGYYGIGLYPIYIAFGAAFLGSKLHVGNFKYLKPILVTLPVVFTILIYDKISAMSPNYYIEYAQEFEDIGMLRWEDGKNHPLPQDFADMLGWKELAEKVEIAYNKLPNKNQTIVLCDNYGQAGAINYYTKNKNIKAVSFNADYINWFQLDTPILNLIRVKEFDENSEELEETSPYFKTASIGGAIQNKYAREFGTTIFVFTGAKTDINAILRGELALELK